MTLVANLTHFLVSSGTVGTTQTVAHGLGVTPSFAILWWNGRTEAVDTTGTAGHRRGMGFAVSTTDRRAISTASNDATVNADSDNRKRSDCCVTHTNGAGTGVGRLDVSAKDATNWTFIVDEVFNAPGRVFLLSVGGTDVTVATGGSFDTRVGTGTQDVTVTGFTAGATDQCVLFLGSNCGDNAIAASSSFCFGAMAGDGTTDAVYYGHSADDTNPTTMITSSYCRRGECGVHANVPSNDALTMRFEGTTWLTDGFRINVLEEGVAAGKTFYFLAIKGPQFKLGAITTSVTTGANVSSEANGFTPLAGLHVSANRAESTADTLTAHDNWSMGGWTGLSNRGAMWIGDEDAVGTSDVYTDVQFDNVYINRLATTGALDGEADIDVIGSTFELDMTDGDPTACFMWYLAIGAAAAVSTSLLFPNPLPLAPLLGR